jgi:hypothetical protein
MLCKVNVRSPEDDEVKKPKHNDVIKRVNRISWREYNCQWQQMLVLK